MDFDAQQVFQPYLLKDERVLWTGRPARGIKLRLLDTFMIPFSIFWAGFSFVWEYFAITSDAPFIFPLFGIPFVVIGFQLLIGRFFQDASNRSKTAYAVTNQRAMVAYQGKTTKIKSWNLDKISIETKRKNDGSGTILFGKTNQEAAGFPMPFIDPPLLPEFSMIEDVNLVGGIMEKAKAGYERGGSFWGEESEWNQENTETGVEE